MLDAVVWRVRRGERWAVWGPNGAGKSTLLDLLAGRLAPTSGRLRRTPGLQFAWAGQDARLPHVATLSELAEAGLRSVRDAERALREEERRLADGIGDLERYAALQDAFERAGGYRAEARLRAELSSLLPDRPADTPVGALSAGERRRAALALALAERGADLLLLDEPTNRLDAPTRAWLADRLRRTPDSLAVIVASHDRELLAAVSTASAHVADGRVDASDLPFEADRARRGAVRRSAAERARRQRREAERLTRSADVARRHGSPSRAAAARSLSRRADGHAAAARAAEAGALAAGDAPSAAALPTGPVGRGTPGPLLRARGLRAEGRFEGVRLDLDAGEKVVLLGRNGQGASRLLGMLAADVRPDAVDAEIWLRPGARVVHWDATERGLDASPVREQLLRWVGDERADALLALVRLPHDRWSAAPDALSGGQRGRAALALLLASEPDLALLDQPEADLDLPSLEQLEQALVDARTAVVLATHDMRLADAVATDVRSFEDGRLIAWRGGVAGWRAGRRRRERDLPKHAPVPQASPPEPPSVDRLEDEQGAIEALLEDPSRGSERDRARLERRRRDLIEARMAAYDATYPPPAPRFRATEPPLVATADLIDGRLELNGPDWPSAPVVRQDGDVVHLILADPKNACWSGWARTAALRACLSLIVPLVAPRAVQTRAGRSAAPPPFTELGPGWWIATREAWERWSGWT